MKPTITKTMETIVQAIQANDNRDITAKEYAEVLNITPAAVNARFNYVIERGLGYREEAKATDQNGKTKKVKFLKLTQAGMSGDYKVEN